MARYDDKFRSSAVVLLEAAGYPADGALAQVSRRLRVPKNTLKGWVTGMRNPPPDETVVAARKDLKVALEDEMDAILQAMNVVREEASYRDLGIVFGIMTDKYQLINDKPTENVKQAITFERTGITTLPEHLAPVAIESAEGEETV